MLVFHLHVLLAKCVYVIVYDIEYDIEYVIQFRCHNDNDIIHLLCACFPFGCLIGGVHVQLFLHFVIFAVELYKLYIVVNRLLGM